MDSLGIIPIIFHIVTAPWYACEPSDLKNGKKQFPRPLGLAITISFPPVNNHVDMDSLGIIPIIFHLVTAPWHACEPSGQASPEHHTGYGSRTQPSDSAYAARLLLPVLRQGLQVEQQTQKSYLKGKVNRGWI